jgi:hypothetical protein
LSKCTDHYGIFSNGDSLEFPVYIKLRYWDMDRIIYRLSFSLPVSPGNEEIDFISVYSVSLW